MFTLKILAHKGLRLQIYTILGSTIKFHERVYIYSITCSPVVRWIIKIAHLKQRKTFINTLETWLINVLQIKALLWCHMRNMHISNHWQFNGLFDRLFRQFNGLFDRLFRQFNGLFDRLFRQSNGLFDRLFRQSNGLFDRLFRLTTERRQQFQTSCVKWLWKKVIVTSLIKSQNHNQQIHSVGSEKPYTFLSTGKAKYTFALSKQNNFKVTWNT